MRARLASLVAALRAAGVSVSVAEAIDAADAVGAVGVERAALADALAAALIKDEGDRAIFEECFARVFPLVPRRAPGGRRRSGPRGSGDAGEGAAAGGGASASGGKAAGGGESPGGTRASQPEPRAPRPGGPRGGRDDDREAPAMRPGTAMAEDGERQRRDERAHGQSIGATNAAAARVRAQRARALRTLPFQAMSPRDVEDAAALVRELSRRVATRLRRRLQPRSRGRLDVRRTLRAATSHGGVPLDRRFRQRRPRRPTLLALCDVSASTASATDFFLSLLAPATAYFARVRLFGFVDHLVEIEFADGRVRPEGRIDLMARSDFGRVLAELTGAVAEDLTADTVVLILGDARNNRRPPRADLLGAVRARVRRIVWLNPEPRARWNTGDSVIELYARHVDTLLACGSLVELESAMSALAR